MKKNFFLITIISLLFCVNLKAKVNDFNLISIPSPYDSTNTSQNYRNGLGFMLSPIEGKGFSYKRFINDYFAIMPSFNILEAGGRLYSELALTFQFVFFREGDTRIYTFASFDYEHTSGENISSSTDNIKNKNYSSDILDLGLGVAVEHFIAKHIALNASFAFADINTFDTGNGSSKYIGPTFGCGILFYF